MTADITIVGVGLLGIAHMSREAEDAVRTARVVFCSTYNAGIAEHVRSLHPGVDLRSSEENEYRVGMHRPDMYRRMATVVLDTAREGPGVVMLAPGSAVVIDLVTQLVLDGARDAGLRARVLPGISSIESVLAEVQYDVSAGVQVVLAQKLVLQRKVLDPTVAAIVMQPAYFDTLHFAGAPCSRSGRFDALEEQLARTWSRDVPMALVITPTHGEPAASVFWLRLGSLGRAHRALSPRHTLFIPPERAAPVDDAFAARIGEWTELVSRVEVDDRGALRQQRRRDAATGALDVSAELLSESELLAERWRSRAR